MPKNKIKLIPVADGKQITTDQEKFYLAASFQSTIEEILYTKSKIVFKEFEKINKKK
jgi:N6-L-threonylcarbamoyladenine synthase|tara:strand:- start:263 stop:433 length:171 start_codon:yes stop_codon:yes gene_type:complete